MRVSAKADYAVRAAMMRLLAGMAKAESGADADGGTIIDRPAAL